MGLGSPINQSNSFTKAMSHPPTHPPTLLSLPLVQDGERSRMPDHRVGRAGWEEEEEEKEEEEVESYKGRWATSASEEERERREKRRRRRTGHRHAGPLGKAIPAVGVRGGAWPGVSCVEIGWWV